MDNRIIWCMIILAVAGLALLLWGAFSDLLAERREWKRAMPAVGAWNYKGRRRRTVETESEEDQIVRMGW